MVQKKDQTHDENVQNTDGMHDLSREEDIIRNPEKFVPIIHNNGVSGRVNSGYFGIEDATDYYEEKNEDQKKKLEMEAFRVNCEMICDALTADDEEFDEYLETQFEQDYRTWEEMVEDEPDKYVDTGFTCGITPEYAQQLAEEAGAIDPALLPLEEEASADSLPVLGGTPIGSTLDTLLYGKVDSLLSPAISTGVDLQSSFILSANPPTADASADLNAEDPAVKKPTAQFLPAAAI